MQCSSALHSPTRQLSSLRPQLFLGPNWLRGCGCGFRRGKRVSEFHSNATARQAFSDGNLSETMHNAHGLAASVCPEENICRIISITLAVSLWRFWCWFCDDSRDLRCRKAVWSVVQQTAGALIVANTTQFARSWILERGAERMGSRGGCGGSSTNTSI